jgi:hypothetical protein
VQQLGPAVERNQGEQLGVAIDRAFDILQRRGSLDDIPIPEELQGVDIKVRYTSPLSQLQRAVSVSSIERGASFAGNLAAVFPEIVDNFDADDAFREYGERIGMPPSTVRSPEDVEKIRAGRAQQQAAANAAASAPAMKDGAEAARLLSETDTGRGGSSLLAQVLGNA